jgi:hypothetical protein
MSVSLPFAPGREVRKFRSFLVGSEDESRLISHRSQAFEAGKQAVGRAIAARCGRRGVDRNLTTHRTLDVMKNLLAVRELGLRR